MDLFDKYLTNENLKKYFDETDENCLFLKINNLLNNKLIENVLNMINNFKSEKDMSKIFSNLFEMFTNNKTNDTNVKIEEILKNFENVEEQNL